MRQSGPHVRRADARGTPDYFATVYRKEVANGRLRAARIGGRNQIFTTTAWLDAYMELSSKPVLMPARRLA